MINNVVLAGRVTKDIELRKTQSNKSVAQFSLAIKDNYQKEHTDFIDCVAWGSSAEYLSNYARKGNKVSVVGRISTRSYEKDGRKIYVTEVIAEKVNILSDREKSESTSINDQPSVEEEYDEDSFGNTPYVEISSDDLPFY